MDGMIVMLDSNLFENKKNAVVDAVTHHCGVVRKEGIMMERGCGGWPLRARFNLGSCNSHLR